MNNKISLIIIYLFVYYTKIFTQVTTPVNVPSPQAYSFFRYSEIPVNHSTGLPKINIPLITIKEGSLELPLSLSYHAGTIKPNEQPGWVGLGWTLNVGGVITRTVNGRRDELINIGWFFKKSANSTNLRDLNFDGSPDVFHFSFNGYSGNFFLDQNNNFLIYPYKSFKIELITDSDDYGDIDGVCDLKYYWDQRYSNTYADTYFKGFIITTSDGTKYEFKQIEYSFPKGAVTQPENQVINTWYLTRIRSANGYDEINISYQKPTTNKFHCIIDKVNNSEFYETSCNQQAWGNNHNEYITSLNELVYISEISCKKSKQNLKFFISPKNDLQYPRRIISEFPIFNDCNYRGHKLDSIKLSYNGVTKRCFRFDYRDTSDSKLKLLSVTELSANRQPINPPYLFEYSAKSMSYNDPIDHWGFYTINPLSMWVNGLNDIQGRKPLKESYKVEIYPDILLKITYPTKGYTFFVWEQNTFSRVADNNNYQCQQFNSENYYRSGKTYNDIKANKINEDTYFDLNYNENWVYVRLTFYDPINGTNSGGCYCGGHGVCNIKLYYPRGRYSLNAIIDDAVNIRNPGISVCDDKRNVYSEVADGVIYSAEIMINKYENTNFEYTGGVRIKTIIDYDPINNKTMTRNYEYKLADGRSSGVISTFPQYDLKKNIFLYFDYSTGPLNGAYFCNALATFSSAKSVSPISFTDGCHVNYSKVTEKLSDGSKINYYFTTFIDYPDAINNRDPRDIYIDNSIFRGKVIREEHFSSSNNLVRTKEYTYVTRTILDNAGSAYGFSGEKLVILGNYNASNSNGHQTAIFFNYVPYLYLLRDRLIRTVKDSVDGVITTTTYNYTHNNNNNYYFDLPVSEETAIGGTIIRKNYIYPIDYSRGSSDFIDKLVDANIINKPIEQYTELNNNVIEGQLTTYKTGSNLGLADIFYQLPIPATNFTPSNYNRSFKFGTYENKIMFISYSNGNLIQYRKANDIDISYIWGYNNTVPIAEVKNATSDRIVFESFEEGSFSGKSTPGHTGNYSLYDKSYTTKTLPKGTYKVSYWRRAYGSNNWELIENIINLNSSSTINVDETNKSQKYFIDDIRIYPVGAQMTTYTYEPLVGITSKTDENDVTTYYEYDSFGRLVRIRDHENNIIKQYDYHYKDQ